MKVQFRIPIFGDDYQLATLSKYDDVPSGIYSDRPVNSSIALTKQVKAHVRLKVEDVALDNNGIALLVSDNNVKISELLSTLGVENFEQFLREAEAHGWKVEKFIDAISEYFLLDEELKPKSFSSIISNKIIQLACMVLMIASPAICISLTTNGYLYNPWIIFACFLSITALVYVVGFNAIHYIKTGRFLR